jgi:hypothetical protein
LFPAGNPDSPFLEPERRPKKPYVMLFSNIETEIVMTMTVGDTRCFLCESPVALSETAELYNNGDFSEVERRLVWNKIFQRSLIPNSKFDTAYEVCKKRRLCSECRKDFDEMGKLQRRIVGFDLFIKHKVEMLGKFLAVAFSEEQKAGSDSEAVSTDESLQSQRLWRRFKCPVIQSRLSSVSVSITRSLRLKIIYIFLLKNSLKVNSLLPV